MLVLENLIDTASAQVYTSEEIKVFMNRLAQLFQKQYGYGQENPFVIGHLDREIGLKLLRLLINNCSQLVGQNNRAIYYYFICSFLKIAIPFFPDKRLIATIAGKIRENNVKFEYHFEKIFIRSIDNQPSIKECLLS